MLRIDDDFDALASTHLRNAHLPAFDDFFLAQCEVKEFLSITRRIDLLASLASAVLQLAQRRQGR
jgi:hypothetical protein